MRFGPDVTCDATDGGWRCRVVLGDGDANSVHEVTLDRRTLDDLAPGATPEALVTSSFEFLLEREPPEAILRSFDLPIIGRYFAEYADEIRRRFAA